MKAALKRKWIAALRSGKYKQGQGFLRLIEDDGDKPEWCCLGVLADVAGCRFTRMGHIGKNTDPYSDSFIPDGVAKRLGIGPAKTGDTEPAPLQRQLSDLNDEGMSFTRIADWIEKNL